MTKGSEQLRCPNVIGCEENDIGGLPCPHGARHTMEECKNRGKSKVCPACIPVEAKKPEVIHVVGEHTIEKPGPEKKEEKCKNCKGERQVLKRKITEGGKRYKYLETCNVCKGTGKAVGQGVEEIKRILMEFSSKYHEIGMNYLSDDISEAEYDKLKEPVFNKTKQQLESFYRKEICGEIEEMLWNKFGYGMAHEIRQAIQTLRKKGE